jgi:hypothetical protein
MAKRPKWVTFALDVLDYHEQQQKEFGESVVGRPAGSKDGWSIRNTAEAQKISLGQCHNLLVVGRAIRKNNTISYASSFNAAIKLAKDEL